MISLVPAVISPVNSIVDIVPQPPAILRLLLIVVLPSIVVSPVTELTTNTSLAGSEQSLEIVNFCSSADNGVTTLITSP